MSLCQLNEDMKNNLKNKLIKIRDKVNLIVELMESQNGCLLCEISDIKNLAHELESTASYYHFHSSLLPNIEGLEEIAKALSVLSKKHHGALLVVEQKDRLDTLISSCNTTGIAVGAAVSAPLLQAIFYPGNPLHDGAVIIRSGEIISAGCVLPLSEKKHTKEGRKIGTRHRAALGLSEISDALVIIVSEETGQVSFAIKGVFHSIEINLCEKGNFGLLSNQN